MRFAIWQTNEFKDWIRTQSFKTQVLIVARLERLQVEGHWGWINKFDGLIELKWASGIRVYTVKIEDSKIIVLLGGNKNGQSKDIKKAQKLSKKYIG